MYILPSRCEPDVQKLITSFTFEELITTQNGMTASRALVNVVIDQQIGQQISVRCCFFCARLHPDFIINRLTLSVKYYSRDVDLSAALTMSCFTRFVFFLLNVQLFTSYL